MSARVKRAELRELYNFASSGIANDWDSNNIRYALAELEALRAEVERLKAENELLRVSRDKLADHVRRAEAKLADIEADPILCWNCVKGDLEKK